MERMFTSNSARRLGQHFCFISKVAAPSSLEPMSPHWGPELPTMNQKGNSLCWEFRPTNPAWKIKSFLLLNSITYPTGNLAYQNGNPGRLLEYADQQKLISINLQPSRTDWQHSCGDPTKHAELHVCQATCHLAESKIVQTTMP